MSKRRSYGRMDSSSYYRDEIGLIKDASVSGRITALAHGPILGAQNPVERRTTAGRTAAAAARLDGGRHRQRSLEGFGATMGVSDK